MTGFLQTWREGADFNRDDQGQSLEHTASDLFRKREVDHGDSIYVAHIEDGRLHLIGRLVVERLLDQRQAEAKYGRNLWTASDHAIGRGTPKVLNRLVPHRVARELAFDAKTGRRHPDSEPVYQTTYLTFEHGDRLRGQTTRTVRRLSDASARALERLL